MRSVFPLFLLSIIGLNTGCNDLPSKLPQARIYTIVSDLNMDMAGSGRTGRMWEITSDGKTFGEMAQTCILAANELSRKYRDDLTYVSLVPSEKLCGTGVYYAVAVFARDRKGFLGVSGTDPNTDHNWEWKVSSTETCFSEKELEMVLLWYGHMRDFPSKEVFSSLSYDRQSLTEYVAREMKIDVSEINLPRITYKDYPITEK